MKRTCNSENGSVLNVKFIIYKNTRRKTRLITKRVSLLNAIGFDWEVKPELNSDLGAGTGADVVVGEIPAIAWYNAATGADAVGLNDRPGDGGGSDFAVAVVSARFRAAAARLRGLAHPANLVDSYDDTAFTRGVSITADRVANAEEGCNRIARMTSQVASRMLCAVAREKLIGSENINMKIILKPEISKLYFSKPVSKDAVLKKLFAAKKVSKSAMKAAAAAAAAASF